MADDVLRLRTVVVSDQALADLRTLGREFGMLPRQAQRGIEQINREMGALEATIRRTGSSLRNAITGLSGFAFGAAGVGLATSNLARGLGDVSKSLVALAYSSKELGLTTQQIKGLTTAAERVGIAPEAMATGLQTFKRNIEDFKMRTGALREEMNQIGAGALATRIAGAKTTLDALKEAFDFKEAADKFDKTGVTGRRVLEKLTGDAHLARMTWEEAKAAIGEEPILSEKQMADAKRYNDIIINLDRSLRNLKQREALKFFDKLEEDKATIQWLVDKFKEIEGATDKIREKLRAPPGEGGGMKLPSFKGRGGGKKIPGFQHGGVFGRSTGQDLLQGSQETLTKTRTKGMYDALTQFASFQQASGGGGGLGSGSIAGGGGGGGGAGGYGGRGGLGGSERSSDSTVTPSNNEKAAAQQAGPLPGMPQYPGVPGTTPGVGTAGPLGLPATPGAPATPVAGAPGVAGATGGAAGTGGGGPDGDARLAADRARFKQELDANPALRDKVLRIAANEQGQHGQGTQAVIETMMNRASSRGTSLAAQAKWTGERGYYDQGNMGRGALENAKHREILEGSLNKTLSGSNITDYATDNASAGLAAKRKARGEMNWTKDYGGESFFQPGRVSGTGNVQKYAAWRQRLGKGEAAPQVAANAPAIPPLAPGDPTVSKSDTAKAADQRFPEKIMASGGQEPRAFIAHHTAGRGSIAGLQATLQQRGLGVQYGMDRDGNITVIGGPGAAHMKPGQGVGEGLSNQNVVGMEIIAKNDADVTAAQRDAFAKFMAARYPNTPIFGHGEVNPHKERDEGQSSKRAALELRQRIARGEKPGPAVPAVADAPLSMKERGLTANMSPAPTKRVDVANDAKAQHPQKTGTVGVEVKSNGTKAEAKAKTDGELFDKTKITTNREQAAEAGVHGP